MAEKPQASMDIRDFPGLVTEADAHDLKPGAAEVQTNFASDKPGELRTRVGMRQVTFED